MATAPRKSPHHPTKTTQDPEQDFAFEKKNYQWMIIGILVIIAGFILMSGGGSKDPNVFSDDIFSFRRITLAPFVVLAGFGIEFYAILKKF